MRDHKSLRAWLEAKEISHLAIDAAREHWKPWAAGWFGQFQRATLSIRLNIAEGYAYGRPRMFVRHLGIAYASAIETIELFEMALEKAILPEELCRKGLGHCGVCRGLLLGLIRKYRG